MQLCMGYGNPGKVRTWETALQANMPSFMAILRKSSADLSHYVVLERLQQPSRLQLYQSEIKQDFAAPQHK